MKIDGISEIENFEIEKKRKFFQSKFNENRLFDFLRFPKFSIFIEFALGKFRFFRSQKFSFFIQISMKIFDLKNFRKNLKFHFSKIFEIEKIENFH